MRKGQPPHSIQLSHSSSTSSNSDSSESVSAITFRRESMALEKMSAIPPLPNEELRDGFLESAPGGFSLLLRRSFPAARSPALNGRPPEGSGEEGAIVLLSRRALRLGLRRGGMEGGGGASPMGGGGGGGGGAAPDAGLGITATIGEGGGGGGGGGAGGDFPTSGVAEGDAGGMASVLRGGKGELNGEETSTVGVGDDGALMGGA